MVLQMHHEWEAASRWIREGKKVALASVIETWGSSPRPLGSILVIREDEVFEGSVSGGCVEGTVIVEALDVLETGEPRVLEFNSNTEDVWVPGLSCGGKISIFVQRLEEDNYPLVHKAAETIAQTLPVILICDLETGKISLFSQSGQNSPPWAGDLKEAALKSLETRTPVLIRNREKKVFVNFIPPAKRLFLFGAVHVAKTLVPMAEMAGFKVTLVDPREAFANGERFQNQELVVESPGRYLSLQRLTSECAVVTLTHDPKLDEPALEIALKSDCFYIGALGSRKTHRTRLSNLKARGFSDKELQRISGPVGLSIGSKTPSEIAVSIVAEMIATYRKPGHAKG